MEAKDTVMTLEQALSYGGYRYACEAQAEISFKAGIREVVKWEAEYCNDTTHSAYAIGLLRIHCTDCRRVKLEDWGIGVARE